MRINNVNIAPEEERPLLEALLLDVEDINDTSDVKIYLDYQDYHNTYSPERVEPCPDYYGSYRIKAEGSDNTLGEPMTIKELDSALFLLSQFIENYEILWNK